MKEKILAIVKTAFPEAQDLTISEPSRISEGWETEIYSFDVAYKADGEPRRELLILRIFPGQGTGPQAVKEFNAMKRLFLAGYPVPLVLHQGGEDSPFGKPFILMERISGRNLWSFMFRPETDHKDQLLDQFCGLFVQLHELDWVTVAGETFSSAEGNPYQFVDRRLQDAQEYGQRFEISGFDAHIEWLRERRDAVPCLRPSLIHHDFHPANILIREDGSAVVIDWSGYDLSDSRYDLAWTLLLVGSYESLAWRDRLLRSYERHSGKPAEQLAFFEVSACLRRLSIILVSLRGGAGELGLDPNALTLIKQQMPSHQRVYDLLLERTGIPISEIEQLFADFS